MQPSGLTAVALRPSALLLLSPGGPGLPPVWVTAGLGLAVLAALLPQRRTAVTAAGWCVAAAGYLGAVVVSRASGPPAGGTQATGWPGAALALAALGLLLAAAPAAQWLAHGWTGRPASRRLLTGAVLTAAATAPLLVAGYWVADGVQGPVGAVSAPVLPAFVSASSAEGTQYRTLILREDGSVLDYSVVRQGDPTLGEPELTASTPAEQALTQQVSALAAPDGADAGDPGLVLGDFGIRWVLLPGPVDPALSQRLDASVGLVPLSKAPAYDLWQVTGPVARVRVIAANGGVTTLSSQSVGMSAVEAPATGGTLVLAEPSGGWTATLNGTALKPLAAPVDGWAQGFALPAGGGKLAIARNNTARDLSLIAELLVLLAVCVLALPGKRDDPVAEAQALAAVQATQHGRRGGRTAKRPARGRRRVPQEATTAGGIGRGAGLAARAGLAGRAAALGAGRRRSAPSASGRDDEVTTGSGVGVLADSDEGDQTAQWDRRGQWQQAPWETDPRGTSWDSGPQQAVGSGPQPTWDSGPRPTLGTGPQPTWDSGPQPTWDSGPQPTWDSGQGTGPRAAWQSGPQPAARQPGGRPQGPERNEHAERHSHRASRRGRPGRPGRRRGSGDRSSPEGDS